MISTILIDYDAYQDLRLFTEFAPGEVSGLGTVIKMGDILYVDKVYLFEQEASFSHTVIGKETMSKFMGDLMDQGVETERVKLWWHTHADFGTFWSKTDTDTIDGWNNETDEDNWVLSIELNKKGSIINRVDVFSPLRITVENLPLLPTTHSGKRRKEVAEEVAAKVKKPAPVISKKWWRGKNWENNDVEVKGEIIPLEEIDFNQRIPTQEEIDDMEASFDNEAYIVGRLEEKECLNTTPDNLGLFPQKS